MTTKEIFCTAAGIVGSGIAYFFGGFNEGIYALLIFMLVDIITGILVSSVFHKSKKTESGGLSSKVGFKGICKKITVLFLVGIAHQLDLILGLGVIRDAAVIGFICNEGLSIFENAGLMGIPMPKALSKGIDILQDKIEDLTSKAEEKKEDEDNGI